MADEPTSIELSLTKQSRRSYGWWLFFALVVLLIALCLPFVIQYRQQITLLDRIEQAGGETDSDPVGPEWLRNLLGKQTMRGFDTIWRVDVKSSLVTDNWIEDLASLTDLQVLGLDYTEITDAGLVHLKGLANLEVLYLGNTQITDSGLVHLKGLSKLFEFSLDNTEITDAGLVHLSDLSNLYVLYLDNTQVSDSGLVHLEGLSNLKQLFLEDTQVSESGSTKLQSALPDCVIILSRN